jgi:hypothetical protein
MPWVRVRGPADAPIAHDRPRAHLHRSPSPPLLLQPLNKGSKMLNFINARIRVTIQDSCVASAAGGRRARRLGGLVEATLWARCGVSPDMRAHD